MLLKRHDERFPIAVGGDRAVEGRPDGFLQQRRIRATDRVRSARHSAPLSAMLIDQPGLYLRSLRPDSPRRDHGYNPAQGVSDV